MLLGLKPAESVLENLRFPSKSASFTCGLNCGRIFACVPGLGYGLVFISLFLNTKLITYLNPVFLDQPSAEVDVFQQLNLRYLLQRLHHKLLNLFLRELSFS